MVKLTPLMDKNINYEYEFNFTDGSSKTFKVELDGKTLSCLIKPDSPVFKRALGEQWTKLKFQQCRICPLTEGVGGVSGMCPAALAIFEVVEFFKNKISYEDVTVKISSSLRGYFKKTKIQEGLSALLGLLMASSGCPVLGKLKPMTIMHLPFARSYETVYRAVSMYLLAQYFIKKKGLGEPDWELKNLVKIFHDVREVNKSFSERILMTVEKDASSNAIVILDCFAISTALSLTHGEIKKLESFFEPYLSAKKK